MFSGGSSTTTRSSAGAFGSAAVHALVAVLLSYFSVEPEKPKEPVKKPGFWRRLFGGGEKKEPPRQE